MIINRLGQHRSHDHITHKRKKEQETNEACQILNLPDECLFIILSHVPMHQLIEISAVCKRLRTITMDDLLWNAHFTQLLNSISPAPGTIKRRKKSIEQKENKVKITRNLEYLSKLHRNLWNTNELPIELFNPESFGKSDDHPLVTDIWTTNDTGNSENEDIIWGERKPCCRKVVVAGKLNKLIEILTCVEEIDLQFVKAFLMTFESFTFAEVFFIKLMQRYHVPLSTQALFPSVEHWKKELFFPVRFRVVNILKLLIEKHVERICFNEWIMERICLLIGITLPLHGLHKFASDLEKLLKKKIHEYEIQEEQVEELEELLPVPTSFSWIPFPDDLIASQITLLDHLTYRSIKPSEMLDISWTKPNKHIKSPNLIKMLNRFNSLSHWASSEILKHETPLLRARIIERIISIAEHLFKLNNFQSMSALLAALNGYAIVRLKRTWSEIGANYREPFQKMEEVMSAQYSFKNYRQTIYNVEPPCVPFLGVSLMDLDFLEGGREFTGNMIAFGRRQRIYEVISFALLYQTPTFSIPRHPQLYSLFHFLPCDYQAGEEFLVQRSLQLEARPPTTGGWG